MTIKDIITLTLVKGIGPATIKKYLDRLRTDNDLYKFVNDIKPQEVESLPLYQQEADSILSICQKERIDIIDITSYSYPPLLKEISSPPSILYVKGNKKLLETTVIAIIGTRHSTELGNRIAKRLGGHFSQRFSICNGLVEGIDEHSIFSDDRIVPNVIGIISGGLCYKTTCSKNHVRVIEEVLNNNGLVISECPPLKKEDQYSGSISSRIQAGLSSGIILVQSKVNGGSKYTFDKFVKLGRVIGIIDFPSNPEYNDDIFEANRLISKEGERGIAKFVGLKTEKSLKIKAIVPIAGKSDYRTFEDLLKVNDEPSNLFAL